MASRTDRIHHFKWIRSLLQRFALKKAKRFPSVSKSKKRKYYHQRKLHLKCNLFQYSRFFGFSVLLLFSKWNVSILLKSVSFIYILWITSLLICRSITSVTKTLMTIICVMRVTKIIIKSIDGDHLLIYATGDHLLAYSKRDHLLLVYTKRDHHCDSKNKTFD